ncbi:chaperone modulator CbpM [Peterkaempfera bronchialis]|uniref:MerR family transcriptional regulator n=1 Tax=Peterkaempfera bronchialis TaxID=2126346 RepID=A0A345SS05_9ACTN|nr:chaperone modulator CbpM [Peterkaempfera bronchialis]AXI76510.1 MerR family transcriptional regulator [Peterkaempfera bronchialis]
MTTRSTRAGQQPPERRYPLARPHRLSAESLARTGGVHPDLVRRFAVLGLLDAERDATGRLWFPPGAPYQLARIQRLRAGLCLNYASIGLVLDLLDHIDHLEAELRRRPHRTPWAGARSEPPWT